MQNNHYWSSHQQNSLYYYNQLLHCPWTSMYQLYPSSSNLSNMLYPNIYSSLNLEESLSPCKQRIVYVNNYPQLNLKSVHEVLGGKQVKIETNQDCRQEGNKGNVSFDKKSQIKEEYQDSFQILYPQIQQQAEKQQAQLSSRSLNNLPTKKQNQPYNVEHQHKAVHFSPSKPQPNQPYTMSTIKQLTKQLIICILNGQQTQSEMLITTIKNEILKLTSQSNKRSKRSVNQLLDDVIKILSLKFGRFKKTKQEMIKYVFRKIFNVRNKPESISQNDWKVAQRIHKKNCSSFKSMNMKYVEKQFQNPIFVQLFSIFLTRFHFNFQKQNQERIDRLNKIVATVIVYEDLTELKSYKKMPWNSNIFQSIGKLFEELKEIQRSARKSLNVNEFLEDQVKKDLIIQKNNSKDQQCRLE